MRLKGVIVTALLILLLPLTVAGAQQPEPLRVVATTTQASDLVRVIGGDLVGTRLELVGLMGAGVDPHLYRPTEADVTAINDADLVVYSGLHLEGQFDTVFEALNLRETVVFALSTPVDEAGYVIGGFEGEASLADPHFWFDPRNWDLSAAALADQLGALDPANAQTYAANYAAYSAELTALFDWATAAMSAVPEAQRVLVTSHDAFTYFGGAFGWQVRGLQGISTADEAGVGDIQALAAFIVESEIPVMFVESSVPPATIESVQQAVQSQGGAVRLGVRELYSDAMDAPGTFGGTYTGMIGTNVITILQSFDVAVPPWPEAITAQPPAELVAS